MRNLILAAALLSMASCTAESTWRKVNEPATDFLLEDKNPDSPSFGEMRSLVGQGKVIVLYFGNYG